MFIIDSNSIVSPSIKLHLNFPEKILMILINEKASLLLPIFILVALSLYKKNLLLNKHIYLSLKNI
ncbi:hypothetical protein, partial [Clostridioides difficile]|uniref:hypothetical protein n=1 Tax=Clostridioides difficile TaxID=1496 RepID=UPI001A9A479B